MQIKAGSIKAILRLMTSYLEKTFGITSPDTGKEIIEAIRLREYTSMNFEAYFENQLHSILQTYPIMIWLEILNYTTKEIFLL